MVELQTDSAAREASARELAAQLTQVAFVACIPPPSFGASPVISTTYLSASGTIPLLACLAFFLSQLYNAMWGGYGALVSPGNQNERLIEGSLAVRPRGWMNDLLPRNWWW